ncbi:MAG: hypothetical protein J7621_25685 [Niastella sp.]|nr:hypothetical protein [Niastella sp.]
MTTRLIKFYLAIIPLLVAAAGFGLGHISWTIYLPIWLIHTILMLALLWYLGARVLAGKEEVPRQQAVMALLLVLPWLFISVFFGMGPPPATIAAWVHTATEQQARYGILMGCGILATGGFTLLREELKKRGERFYSTLGIAALLMAAPLFILNMAYWGGFLTRSFSTFINTIPDAPRPDWYKAMQGLFYSIGLVEVALIYLATAAFAAGLKKAGLFRSGPCRLYILFSLLGFVLSCLPSWLPEPFGSISYFVSIPAIPLVIPYLMGLNLLQRSNDLSS